MPKTSHRRRSSSVAPPADINDYSTKQLARLPAEIPRLHLASRHLVTSGSKATMPKCLYDALNPPATYSNDASRSQVAPLTSTLFGNTPPSTNQLTTASAVYPPALQAQLLSLMAQFLQYVMPSASISHEAAQGATRTTSNLFHTATDTYGPYSSHSSCPNSFHRCTAGTDTDTFATTYAYQWLDYAAITLPVNNAASNPPNDQQHHTTRASTDMPKDHTR